MSRLKDLYKDEIVSAMMKKFGYKNIMEVPKLDKIVINMGVGEAKDNAKLLEAAVKVHFIILSIRQFKAVHLKKNFPFHFILER